jgi:hypothetical protein
MELTRESILAMGAGKALDIWIAGKVMGWERGIDFDIDDYREGVARYEPSSMDVRTFSPSTDISAAWEVVEKLGNLALQAPGSTDMNENYRNFKTWTADFIYRFHPDSEATGETAPLAICRAALLTTLNE